MRATVADPEQLVAVADQEHRRTVHVHLHRLAIRQIGHGQNRDPTALIDLGVDVVAQLARLLPSRRRIMASPGVRGPPSSSVTFRMERREVRIRGGVRS
jgi:hypothetical protein